MNKKPNRNINEEHISKIFKYWQTIEALTFPSLPKRTKGSIKELNLKNYQKQSLEKYIAQWIKKNEFNITIRVGSIRVYSISKMLEFAIGKPQKLLDRPDLSTKSPIFELTINEKLLPEPDGFNLSLPMWIAGKILEAFRSDKSFNLRSLMDEVDFKTFYLIGKHLISSNSEKIIYKIFFLLLLGGEFDWIDLFEEFLGIDEDLSEIIEEIKEESIKLKKYLTTGFREFDFIFLSLKKALEYERRLLYKKNKKIDFEWLISFTKLVIELLRLTENHIEKSLKKIEKTYKVEDDEYGYNEIKLKDLIESLYKTSMEYEAKESMLNSFFINDLKKILEDVKNGDFGTALRHYIFGISNLRTDVRKREGIIKALEILQPKNFPQGCWPSDPDKAPGFSQQLAINEIWNRFFQQGEYKRGIFSINGPPGTGKTTLLKDIVAGIITERAKFLIENKENIFKYDRKSYKYKINENLKRYTILVASSNNTAVENVSLELPKKDSIHEIFKEESDKIGYFIELINDYLKRKNPSKTNNWDIEDEEFIPQTDGWALIAVALGKSENRKIFNETVIKNLEKHINLSKENLEEEFKATVEEFNRLIEEENKIRKEISKITNDLRKKEEIIENIKNLEEKISEIKEKCKIMEDEKNIILSQKIKLEEEQKRIKELEEIILKKKPNLLEIIFTLFKAYLKWKDELRQNLNEQQACKIKLYDIEDKLRNIQTTLNSINEEIEKIEKNRDKLKKELEEIIKNLKYWEQKLGNNFISEEQKEEERELASPWHLREWRQLRAKIFLKALKIHKLFLQSKKDIIIANLNLLSDWLSGRVINREESENALLILSLIVPVISTTFASVGLMLKNIGRESIGWLLIDEAGQTLPHHAIGAIYRANNVIVVGDPKQLEPVCSLSKGLIDAITEHYEIPDVFNKFYLNKDENISIIWRPDESSSQVLADYANDFGTKIGKDWIGCPLRVHRRCLKPMFDISNEIAYDGLMIYGLGDKKPKLTLFDSCWINTIGKNYIDHWCEEEGDTLEKLIKLLRDKKVSFDRVFIITPFKSCQHKLREKLKNSEISKNKIGTVHVAQGKEADVVIFVLGGNPSRKGAFEWASKKPNLLNVAVSRAKDYLYVIGNLELWKDYFPILSNKLPIKEPSYLDSLFINQSDFIST
ncbi:MAG: DNA2/NAM7 family helicase [Thermodesulfovibrio sp.]|nr:DNA2/NAM7 family helicase [Thermodesulfovibrio sp.]